MQRVKLFWSRDRRLKMPACGRTVRRASTRTPTGLAAATQFLADAAGSARQSLSTLRLLAVLVLKNKRAVLQHINRSSLSRHVGRAVRARTLLGTLRRAALIARAMDRGVSLRRGSQLLWRVPIVARGVGGHAKGKRGKRAGVVYAHSAVSILLSAMQSRCGVLHPFLHSIDSIAA